MNEIEAAAHDAKRLRDAADARDKRTGDWPVAQIAIGVGVGSAALAAALLYASRPRRKK